MPHFEAKSDLMLPVPIHIPLLKRTNKKPKKQLKKKKTMKLKKLPYTRPCLPFSIK